MALIILLFFSIVLQVLATGVAIRLTRATKYNAAWILFIISLVIISLQRIEEFVLAVNDHYYMGWTIVFPKQITGWGGIVSSLCMAAGVMMVRKIFAYISSREQERRLSDKRILKAVIRGEEHHKQRLAKELHDGLGPLLSTAQMSISAIEPRDENQRQIIANAENAMLLAIKTLREVSNNLSPHILENFGLARAVSILAKNFGSTDMVCINFRHNISGQRFDGEIEVAIYRVLSELLHNTLKHANASTIELSINYIDTVLYVHYQDDGCGFDIDERNLGMGLSNMESRIQSALGTISLQSVLGGGMSAHIEFRL